MLVDLGSLEEWPSNTIPGFNSKLLDLLPGVGEHSCLLGKSGGFRERLEDGTWLGHVAEHVALELQRESGAQITRGKTQSAGAQGRYNVIYGYAEEVVRVEAGKLAVRLLNQLVKLRILGSSSTPELERLILLAERRQFGPSTQAILDEAVGRDIPFIRLNEQSLVQLGQGKYQQRIRATMTSATSALAVDIASDKKMTNQLLADGGPAGSAQRGRAYRGRCRRRGQADRVPRGDQAPRWEPRAWGWSGFPNRASRAYRVQARREGIAQRSGGRGELRQRKRLPGARDRRADGGDRGTRSGACGRRRQALRRKSWWSSPTRTPGVGLGHEKVLTRIKIDDAAIELVRKQGYGMDDVPP